MLLRPYGVILNGRLELGLEVEVVNGVITKVGPQTGMPDPYVLSPAFVNAHSHLEYRGLQGQIQETDFFPWIRAITELKQTQNPEQVQQDINQAAAENKAAGIAYIAEHSDRPGSAKAMADHGLQGHVFQELITFNEQEDPQAKFALVNSKAQLQAQESGLPVTINPHAVYTVDEASLKTFANPQSPLSIHIAESAYENPFVEKAEGPFADLHRRFGHDPQPTGLRAVPYLHSLGLLNKNTQLVHCCDVDAQDLALIKQTGASVAHCPRSNAALGCPTAPVREMLDLRIPVALGLDSPASSGPIDMLAEIQACITHSQSRHKPVTAEEAWNLATTAGAQALNLPNWQITPNATTPLLKLHFQQTPHQTQDLLDTPLTIEPLN